MDARCNEYDVCRTVTDHSAETKTQLGVSVSARIGEVEISCAGEPTVVASDCGNGCSLTVIRRLKLRIPVSYESEIRECGSETTCTTDC